MAYECQNFKDGQVLTAECLNKIEKALEAICNKEITSARLNDNSELVFVFCNGAELNTGVVIGSAESGAGIKSVEQTTTSTADGGTNIVTVTLTDGTKSTFSVKNGSKGSTGAAGKNGNDGAAGKDGVSVTKVEQTTTSTADGGTNVITVTLSNGETFTFNVKNGSKGSTGGTGADGTSVTVSKVTESTADGGSNVVTFSDGKTLTVKNGTKGSQGAKGDTGAQGIQGEKGEKGDTGSNGNDGERGTSILKVTTAPTSYTTAIGGKNPIKRMSISTIKTQASVDEVLVGDCISHSYYLYHIYYLDATYAYMDTSQSIRGATGSAGAAGANGTSVTVTSVSESTEDGGSNVVTFSDGKTLTVKNGSKGTNGKDFTDDIEILIPSDAVAVVGVEFNIYYKSIIRANRPLDNYDIKCYLSNSSIGIERYAECFRLTAETADIGDYTLTVEVRNIKGDTVIASKTMTLHIIENRTVSNKNVLFIGDSLTFSRGGLYAAEIQYNLSDGGIISIGSQTGAQASNTIGAVKHEGYNGATVGGFLSAKITSAFTNPFYNPTTKTFDLAYFMTNQGYSKVDAVCLNLGHNNIGNHVNAVSELQTIITKIHEYNASIPVIISLIAPLAGQDSWRTSGYTAAQMRMHWRNLINAYISAFDNGKISNVYLSTPYFNVDTDNDFPTETVALSARNTTQITRQNDSMHPSRAGTLKMADVYYANLLYRIPDTGTVSYSITNNLTNVTNSNGATTINEGSAYTANLIAASGYALDTVSVTMGGNAVTVTNGVINIPTVTGNIVITATAKSTVVNLVDPSTATSSPDTTTLFKDEWLNGYYLSTSSISAKTGCIVTDIFPISYGQKLKVEGILLSSTENKNRFRWYFFNADGTRPFGGYVNFATNENAQDGATLDAANNTAIIDTSSLPSTGTYDNIAYARFSCYVANGNENVIVTVV